jgi:hypothetical protein
MANYLIFVQLIVELAVCGTLSRRSLRSQLLTRARQPVIDGGSHPGAERTSAFSTSVTVITPAPMLDHFNSDGFVYCSDRLSKRSHSAK